MFYPLLFEICFHLVGNVSFGDGSQIDAGFGIFQCNGVILNVDLCESTWLTAGQWHRKMEPLVYLP